MTHHGTWERLLEVSQKVNWKTKRPRTEMARSPYVVSCITRAAVRNTGSTRAHAEQTHLGKGETESRSENDAEQGQPTESQLHNPREAVERPGNKRTPDRSDRLAYNRARDKPESDYPGRMRT